MGELLPEATTSSKGLLSSKQAMPYNGTIPSDTDLNTLGQGIWIKPSASTNISNIPSGVNNESFLILVERFFGTMIGGGSGFFMQTITTQSGKTFKRIHWSNAWANWIQL